MSKFKFVYTFILFALFYLSPVNAKTFQIVVAMQDEAEPIVKALNLKYKGKLNKLYKSNYYYAKINNNDVYLTTNGKLDNTSYVGSEATVISTILGIEKFKPNILINVGTSGAISKADFKIGDIINISKTSFLDRNIPIPNYKEYSEGNFKPSILNNENKTAINCTSSSFVTVKDINEKMKNLNCETFDMEASSFAFIATEANIKYYVIKSITDFIDSDVNNKHFEENLNLATVNLVDYIKNIFNSETNIDKNFNDI